MSFTWKSGALTVLVIALGVAGGLKLNELINKAKTVAPAKTA